MTGTIARIVRDRGFGFVRPAPDSTSEELVFFHASEVAGGSATFASMSEGDHVTYDDGVPTHYGPAARITHWQPAGAVARALQKAADDIERALEGLNTAYVMEAGTRRFENFTHAKVRQRLDSTPAKLRRQAEALTQKETLVQRDAVSSEGAR